MTSEKKPVDETKVLAQSVKGIEALGEDSRKRVIAYLVQRFMPEALVQK